MAEQLICNQQVDGSTPFTSSSLYGGIPERPKGADCKSVVTDFAGPNPASPTITRNRPLRSVFCYGRRSSRFAPGTCFASALVRIPQPKVEELALQTQVASIFIFDEYPASKVSFLRNRPLRSVFCYGRTYACINPVCVDINPSRDFRYALSRPIFVCGNRYVLQT